MDHAIVLADGDSATLKGLDEAWPGWRDGADFVVAADGGAHLAANLALDIDLWVGDGDSLAPGDLDALRSSGVPVELVSRDKNESDTELAVLAALARGAARITILGALGGARFDHSLANVALLAHPALSGTQALIVGEAARIQLLIGPARATMNGRAGDVVSLIPFGGDVDGVVTSNLRYPLHNERLAAGPARGLSNERTAEVATVSVGSGRLLVVETPATLSR